MPQAKQILFTPYLDIGCGIKLLRVENIHWPFGLLRYTRNGEEQPEGLRLDLGKLDEAGNTLLLDHLDDAGEEQALRKKMSHVTALLERSFSKGIPKRRQ